MRIERGKKKGQRERRILLENTNWWTAVWMSSCVWFIIFVGTFLFDLTFSNTVAFRKRDQFICNIKTMMREINVELNETSLPLRSMEPDRPNERPPLLSDSFIVKCHNYINYNPWSQRTNTFHYFYLIILSSILSLSVHETVSGKVNNSGNKWEISSYFTEWMWTFENHNKRRHNNIFYLQKRPGKHFQFVIGTKLLGLFFSVTNFFLTNVIITSDVFV